jgi:hypothetical protein
MGTSFSTPGNPASPPAPGWDIACTRIANAALPHIDACLCALARQFGALGLRCHSEVRHTPRGLSSFLAVIGQRGLLFIVDITLVDGMAIGRSADASIDVRLLDACGDPVERLHRSDPPGATHGALSPGAVLAAAALAQAATAVYVTALSHFDLAQRRAAGPGALA